MSEQTMDMTAEDYSFTPDKGGRTGLIACWNGYRNENVPGVGDALILRNPTGRINKTSRYRVVSVERPLGVDPPTMWMAHLEFWPRREVES